MSRKALLWATLCLPSLVQAQGAVIPTGTLDLYYLPNANVEVRDPGVSGTDEKGDGFGVRTMAQLTEQLVATAEYQSASYDNGGGDRDDIRAGVLFGALSGTSLVGEYVSIENGDGFGIHGRLGGMIGERTELYVRAGYVQVEDQERFGGFEFSLGGAYSFLQAFGFPLGGFADYRMTSLEGAESQLELKLRDLRVGVRMHFGGRGDMPDAGEEPVGVEPVDEPPPEILESGEEEPAVVEEEPLE